MVPFNKPYISGKELFYIAQSVLSGHISGNGLYTKKCHQYFQDKYGFRKVLLTTSCTDALEMCAMLLDIKEGDEIIMPSYTFVSTALAFVRQGAKIVFADSRYDHPGIDESSIERLITAKTKAIVVVHYADVACDMDEVLRIAEKYKIAVVEDAAQAIDSFYKGKPLGSLGHLATFSFHETKNIQSGEGGLLVVNDERFIKRSEILWEKGTNRAEFFRGEINKYGWVDVGSSFLPSEIVSAFLFAQLEHLDVIQARRIKIWDAYFNGLKELESTGIIKLPNIPEYATNNAHMFYMIFVNMELREKFIENMKEQGFHTVFHYLSLHKSKYYADNYQGGELKYSDMYSENLVRLPLFFELNDSEQNRLIQAIKDFSFQMKI